MRPLKHIFKSAIAALLLSLSAGSIYGETIITINGRTIQSSGSNISITNEAFSSSVNGVRGSGKSASEVRSLNDFLELRLDISANVTIERGDSTKCEITADDNILPLILTEHAGKALLITARESYSTTQEITIAIEVPQLTKAQINGSGTIDIVGVVEEELAVVINGSGDIHSTGKVAELRAKINGSGSLHASDLQTERAMITLNGSGNADIHVTEALVVNMNGSGDVLYSGTPSELNSSVNGSGRIHKK